MPRDSDGEEEDKGTLLSWDAILPDELLQKVLSFLPTANIIRLGIVCKRWYEVVNSCPSSWAMMAPQMPLFFKSCFNDCPFSGSVYDPCFLRWYNVNFDSPRLEKGFRLTSSSCGLVCLMNPSDGGRLLVGNPIKRDWKLLPQVPAGSPPRFNAIALSYDRRTLSYTVVVAKCTSTQLPGKSEQCHLSVHIYQSTTKSWATPFAQDLGPWMTSNQAVICDGVLYHIIRHPDLQISCLVAFDLAKPPSSIQSLIQESIPTPHPLFCAGLVNLSNKLVMVGVLDWPEDDWSQSETAVILELEDKTWREVAQNPISLYKNDFLMCCGTGDLLFIHTFEWPTILTFDMRQKVWKWSSNPYTKQLDFCCRPRILNSCGFCFEPRLDVSS